MSITWDEIKHPRNKFKNNDKWYKVTNNEVEIGALGSGHKFRPCVLADRYRDFVESVWQYQVNSDDVWITTHPVSLNSLFVNIFVCLLCVIISCVITAEWYDMDSVRFFVLFNCSTTTKSLF